jgi:hypothetical protein
MNTTRAGLADTLLLPSTKTFTPTHTRNNNLRFLSVVHTVNYSPSRADACRCRASPTADQSSRSPFPRYLWDVRLCFRFSPVARRRSRVGIVRHRRYSTATCGCRKSGDPQYRQRPSHREFRPAICSRPPRPPRFQSVRSNELIKMLNSERDCKRKPCWRSDRANRPPKRMT